MKTLRLTAMIAAAIVALTLVSVTPAYSASGDKESVISKKELKVLLKTASEPADHRKIAEYYRHEAKNLARRAKEHEEMGAMYQKNPLPYEGKFSYGTVGLSHCRKFAELDAQEVKEAEALAALHDDMAKAAEQKH